MENYGWVAWVISGISVVIAGLAFWRSGRAVAASERSADAAVSSAAVAAENLEIARQRERERLQERVVKVRADEDPRRAGVFMLRNVGGIDAEGFSAEVIGGARTDWNAEIPDVFVKDREIAFQVVYGWGASSAELVTRWTPVNEFDPGERRQVLR